MKTSKILLLVALSFILLAIVVTISSIHIIDNKNSVEGSGNVTSEVRKITPVNRLEIKDRIRVNLEQSDEYNLVIEADSNLIELIKTEIVDSILIIELTEKVSSYHTLKADIKAKDLKNISVEGGARLQTINEFVTDDLDFSASSGSKFDLALNCKSLDCDISSGAHGSIMGRSGKLKVDITSGANLDAKELETEEVYAHANSGAILSVFATGNIDVKSTSGAHVKYYGEPAIRNIDQNSGGRVTKRD